MATGSAEQDAAAENGTLTRSGKSGFFNKCYFIALITLLILISAAFLFFATMRQSHSASAPSKNSELVHFVPANWNPALSLA